MVRTNIYGYSSIHDKFRTPILLWTVCLSDFGKKFFYYENNSFENKKSLK